MTLWYVCTVPEGEGRDDPAYLENSRTGDAPRATAPHLNVRASESTVCSWFERRRGTGMSVRPPMHGPHAPGALDEAGSGAPAYCDGGRSTCSRLQPSRGVRDSERWVLVSDPASIYGGRAVPSNAAGESSSAREAAPSCSAP